MDRQAFYDYLKKRISEIESKRFSEVLNDCEVLIESEIIDIFSGKNETFKIKVSKYKGHFYDGLTVHCKNGGGGYSPGIGGNRKKFNSVLEIIEKNMSWYLKYYERYRDDISPDFRKAFENLEMFPKEGNKILTLF